MTTSKSSQYTEDCFSLSLYSQNSQRWVIDIDFIIDYSTVKIDRVSDRCWFYYNFREIEQRNLHHLLLYIKCVSVVWEYVVSAHGATTSLKGEPLGFFCFHLFIYKLTQWESVENIVLYHKNRMKIMAIWNTVVGISGSGVCGFVVCVVGGWGWRQALNWLKINRLFWRKMVWIMRTPR